MVSVSAGVLPVRGIVYVKLPKGKEFTALNYYNDPDAGFTCVGGDVFYRHPERPMYLIYNFRTGWWLATMKELEQEVTQC